MFHSNGEKTISIYRTSKKSAHYSGLSMGTSQWILNICSAVSMLYAGKLVNDDEMDFSEVMK
jgi:hypothetical protein